MKLTVSGLKAELSSRGVTFLSKLRKKELQELLEASLNLPIVANIEVPCGKNATREPKDRETEDTKLPWNEDHPARILLFKELADGRIPLDPKSMGPAEVYYTYSGTLEFQMKGMSYGDTFRRRLRELRKQIRRDKSRASTDKKALKKALKLHPVSHLNACGKPHWNGSVAQALLEYDMSKGKHIGIEPHKFRNQREQYKALSVDDFRWKVQQQIRTKKYLYTLKYRAEDKLRKTLAKEGVIIDAPASAEEHS